MIAQSTHLSQLVPRPWLLALVIWVQLLLSVFGARQAFAGTPIQYAGEFREQIEGTFFEPDPDRRPGETRVSLEKVASYRSQLEKKRRFLLAHVSTSEQIESGRGVKKAAKAARKTDLALALKLALKWLEWLEHEAEGAAAYETAARILMLEYATRSYTDPIGSIKISIHVKNMLNDWSVPDGTRAAGVEAEAGNLVNPLDGSFYTREELVELVRGGSDLSELNPPDATPFWLSRTVR